MKYGLKETEDAFTVTISNHGQKTRKTLWILPLCLIVQGSAIILVPYGNTSCMVVYSTVPYRYIIMSISHWLE